ncbi:hypothetical protein [Actibacterium ureilyticum]|uniref:hypothetical protein n=1 Tax=Actibacterium ureilyticum TaxID=1590614 RepID=UPI001140AA21|nr:hypothetical protein [Actibacterium ureilyticum]
MNTLSANSRLMAFTCCASAVGAIHTVLETASRLLISIIMNTSGPMNRGVAVRMAAMDLLARNLRERADGGVMV